MGEDQLKQKIKKDNSFLTEMKDLAETTTIEKEVHELINLEDLIQSVNIKRDLKGGPKIESLVKYLLKNPFLNQEDFIYLFEVLQNQYEISSCEYREKIKALINAVCIEAIKRDFVNVRAMVFAKHPSIKNLKAIKELN
jgi:hypothetical protein